MSSRRHGVPLAPYPAQRVARAGGRTRRKRRRNPRQWWRSVKRRRGGIYLWRTRKHAHPTRRENGYVGLTNSFTRRERDHRGKSEYLREDGTVQRATEKPWMDLDAKCHKVIPLPWWLCWRWLLEILETLAILVFWPRYNQAKNYWNPRRVTLARQLTQRANRNMAGPLYRARVQTAVWGRRIVQALGVACILAGIVGALVTR